MDDIAGALGMSKKTLYQHVKDKNDLVNKVVDRTLTKFEKGKGCIVNKGLTAIEELIEITQLMNEHMRNHNPALEYDLKKYYPMLYKKVSESRREGVYKGISENLKKGLAEGNYRKEIDIDIITRIFVSRLEFSFDNPMFTPEEITSNKVFNEIMIYHLHGICNSKGVKIVEEKLKEAALSVQL
jgi:AcrR family transcriptional regulator